MHILVEPPKLPDYIADLTSLLASPRTHIYIDTSFLAWLTRIGSEPRAQFLAWARKFGIGRIHIPLWVSHEFQVHHNDSSLKKILREAASRLTNTAQDVYSEVHPILEEISEGSGTYGQDVASTRLLFSDLHQLGKKIEKWNDQGYDRGAADVIQLINECCIDSGTAFKYLESIGQLCDNRYTGRVPPGFEDRGKKDTETSGGNRAGDLIGWKEILDHACSANRLINRIQAIVVLTKDGKKDWIRGGFPNSAGDPGDRLRNLRKRWPTLPVIHPMLEHEAKVSAKVRRAALANDWALGTYFHMQNIAPAFVTAAVKTELSLVDDAGERRKGGSTQAPTLSVVPSSRKSPVVSPVVISTREMMAAAFDSAGRAEDNANHIVEELSDPAHVDKTIDSWLRSDDASTPWRTWFWTAQLLAYKSVRRNPIASQRLADIISLLPQFDTQTSCSLYAGMIFGVYLDEIGAPVRVPSIACLQSIFRLQSCSFAEGAIDALHEAIGDQPGKAIYIPQKDMPKINIDVLTGRDDKNFILSAVVIDDTDYFVDVVKEDPAALCGLLSMQGEIKISAFVTALAAYLGLPLEQINLSGKATRTIFLRPTDGLNIQLMNQ